MQGGLSASASSHPSLISSCALIHPRIDETLPVPHLGSWACSWDLLCMRMRGIWMCLVGACSPGRYLACIDVGWFCSAELLQ